MNDEDFFNQEFNNCGEIQPLIDELEDNCPDRRTQEYNLWEEKMNFLFESYNKMSMFVVYKKFK